MKIAVFTDIHGNYPATKKIIEDINKQEFDEVIFLGDAIGIGPKSKECLELLLKNKITFIAGNHELYYKDGINIDRLITDENEINHHKWIHESVKNVISKDDINFPLSKVIELNGKKIAFQHYMLNKNTQEDKFPFERISIRNISDVEEYCKKMEFDYLFIGHEHKPFEICEDEKRIVCIGSSGCVKDDKTYYSIVDINDEGIKIEKKYLTFSRDELIEDIKSFKYPDVEVISKIFFGIDL